MEQDMLYGMVYETAAAVGLYMHTDSWMLAQFMAMPEETQEKWRKAENKKDGDHEVSMHAFFSF